MKHRLVLSNLLLLALFLTVTTTALASSTWYVDGVNGGDSNNCETRLHACKTIGHSISLASSGDSIMVAAATFTENLSIGLSLKEIGSGAKTTVIDGGAKSTVVTISSASAHVTLLKVTIRNGLARVGGGINNSGTLRISNSIISANSAGLDGGGVYNSNKTLKISNSRISGNSATRNCTREAHCLGGGIFNNSGNLTINNSDLSGNTVGNSNAAGEGGGVCSFFGTLTINRSTISRNRSTFAGGGISATEPTMTINDSTINDNAADAGGGINRNGGATTINNSTISRNRAQFGGGINSADPLTRNNSTVTENSASTGGGGGIRNWGGTTTLQNSIIAKSRDGGNCDGNMTSNRYNLSSDDTCNFPNSGDLNNTDPKLGQLGNYGGPTQTIPLLHGSPAIDAGNPSGCTDGKGHLLKTDQRGKPRPDKESGRCDMGAYERQKD